MWKKNVEKSEIILFMAGFGYRLEVGPFFERSSNILSIHIFLARSDNIELFRKNKEIYGKIKNNFFRRWEQKYILNKSIKKYEVLQGNNIIVSNKMINNHFSLPLLWTAMSQWILIVSDSRNIMYMYIVFYFGSERQTLKNSSPNISGLI